MSETWRTGIGTAESALKGVPDAVKDHFCTRHRHHQFTSERCSTCSTIIRDSSCPNGYHASASYCVPMESAKFAMHRKGQGSCPSEYFSSDEYCVASSDKSKQAIARTGLCPTGYTASGNYCVATSDSSKLISLYCGRARPDTLQVATTVLRLRPKANWQFRDPGCAQAGFMQVVTTVWRRRIANPVRGPGGYSSTGNRCVASWNSRKFATPRSGPCPVGQHANGEYCVSTK